MNKKKAAPLATIRQPVPVTTQLASLQQWYGSREGEYVFGKVHAAVQGMTADVFGYYALEMGVLVEHCHLLEGSRIGRHIKVSANPFALGVDVQADPSALPIGAGDVDLVVACHVLDYAQSPHQVLREIERVLVPDGHCILIGFNPFSWRGLGQGLRRWRRQQPSPAMYSSFRLCDWFEVLGFGLLETHTFGFRPSWGGDSVFRRLAWLDRWGEEWQLPVGGVQVLHVQKQVSRLTPIRPSLRPTPILKPGMVVNPGAPSVAPLDAVAPKQQD